MAPSAQPRIALPQPSSRRFCTGWTRRARPLGCGSGSARPLSCTQRSARSASWARDPSRPAVLKRCCMRLAWGRRYPEGPCRCETSCALVFRPNPEDSAFEKSRAPIRGRIPWGAPMDRRNKLGTGAKILIAVVLLGGLVSCGVVCGALGFLGVVGSSLLDTPRKGPPGEYSETLRWRWVGSGLCGNTGRVATAEKDDVIGNDRFCTQEGLVATCYKNSHPLGSDMCDVMKIDFAADCNTKEIPERSRPRDIYVCRR